MARLISSRSSLAYLLKFLGNACAVKNNFGTWTEHFFKGRLVKILRIMRFAAQVSRLILDLLLIRYIICEKGIAGKWPISNQSIFGTFFNNIERGSDATNQRKTRDSSRFLQKAKECSDRTMLVSFPFLRWIQKMHR